MNMQIHYKLSVRSPGTGCCFCYSLDFSRFESLLVFLSHYIG